jgi:hypothetical protein
VANVDIYAAWVIDHTCKMLTYQFKCDAESKEEKSDQTGTPTGPFDMLFVLGSFYPLPAADATAFEDYLCGRSSV